MEVSAQTLGLVAAGMLLSSFMGPRASALAQSPNGHLDSGFVVSTKSSWGCKHLKLEDLSHLDLLAEQAA